MSFRPQLQIFTICTWGLNYMSQNVTKVPTRICNAGYSIVICIFCTDLRLFTNKFIFLSKYKRCYTFVTHLHFWIITWSFSFPQKKYFLSRESTFLLRMVSYVSLNLESNLSCNKRLKDKCKANSLRIHCAHTPTIHMGQLPTAIYILELLLSEANKGLRSCTFCRRN